MGRPARTTEHYIGSLARMIRAAGPRVAAGDPEDLALLVGLHGEIDRAIAVGVAGLQRSGMTWRSIGEATGTSREAAFQKWAAKARAAAG
jgi:hypothetical protein